ncbi:hypothetical protein QM306_12430 [Burkholderia cenocepacia]|nr:hypothetical protein [Burkholderia cenocepacia]
MAISDAATDDADTRAALQTMAAAHFAT